MAIASALITSAAHTDFLADRPTILGSYMGAGVTAEWTAAGDGGADITDAAYPVGALFDGHMATWTRPATASRYRYLEVSFATAITIDALFLHVLALNLNDVTTPAVTVTVYNAGGDSVALVTEYGTAYFSTKKRLFAPDLTIAGDANTDQRQFSAITKVVIKFDAANGFTCQPQVCELIVGQQAQMPCWPLYPYDDDARASGVEKYDSPSGIGKIYETFAGAKRMDGMIVHSASTLARAQLVRSSTRHWTRPFVWAGNPLSLPNAAYLMRPERPELFTLLRTGPDRYELPIVATEQGGSLLGDE
jgi:hypothetical protein